MRGCGAARSCPATKPNGNVFRRPRTGAGRSVRSKLKARSKAERSFANYVYSLLCARLPNGNTATSLEPGCLSTAPHPRTAVVRGTKCPKQKFGGAGCRHHARRLIDTLQRRCGGVAPRAVARQRNQRATISGAPEQAPVDASGANSKRVAMHPQRFGKCGGRGALLTERARRAGEDGTSCT